MIKDAIGLDKDYFESIEFDKRYKFISFFPHNGHKDEFTPEKVKDIAEDFNNYLFKKVNINYEIIPNHKNNKAFFFKEKNKNLPSFRLAFEEDQLIDQLVIQDLTLGDPIFNLGDILI